LGCAGLQSYSPIGIYKHIYSRIATYTRIEIYEFII
jgi:hypothetical protein